MTTAHATSPMSRTISQAQADDLVHFFGYDTHVEDSEIFEAEREHRYFLSCGLTLVIGFDGSAKMVTEDGTVLDRQAFFDFEEIGETTVRYWTGGDLVGDFTF